MMKIQLVSLLRKLMHHFSSLEKKKNQRMIKIEEEIKKWIQNLQIKKYW